MEFKHPSSLTALSAIREIQECSTQVTEPTDEQTSRYREILDSILTSLLNDTEKDAEKARPVLERLLECVQHCAQALPVLFLPQKSNEAGSTEQSALRFSESLIGRLLVLLSIPGLGVLSGHCCRVIESLLTLYKRHNMRLLHQFLDNLLEVFVDVYQFCVQNSGTLVAMCHFSVTVSFADQQNVRRLKSEQGSIHICLSDGGCALLLSLMKLLVFLADDMVAFGSNRRLKRDRLVRSLCGLLTADNTELVEASLEVLNAFLKEYYPVTENTETEVLLNVTWLIHCVSAGNISLTSCGTDCLVELLKTVANIQVSPGALEEILLELSKVSSKTYVGVLAMEVGKALAKIERDEEHVRHSVITKSLRDSFVGIKLDRLLYIQDTGIESLKKVAVCLEALQITVLQLLQPSVLSKSQKDAKATAADKATMRVQLNVSSERMVLALLKDCLDRRLDDESLCEVFHILVLLLRCQEDQSLIASTSDNKYMSDCVLKLCTSSHSSIRDAMVSHLPNVLCHLQMDDALIESLLDLLEDADYVVRMKFGNRPLKVLISRGNSSIRGTIISRLKQALNNAWQSENARLQDTLLTAVGCVGQDTNDEDSQAFALLCLLEHLLCRTAGVADIAQEQSMLRFLLPPLVLQAEPMCSRLLKGFAKELKSVRRDLLMTNFKHIFPYLVCHASGDQLATALSFVEAEFLQPRLLGFLTFFDLQLVNRNVPDDKKKEALRSLECILRLIGQQHVTAFRMKLMATLKLALRLSHGDFPSINSCVWSTFIHNLEPLSTGPLLSQITATLLPLLKLDPEGAKSIFNFLFVDNREQHLSFFHDLHFISEVPELEHIQHTVSTPDSQGENNLSNILGHCLHGIAHENLDVRVLALGKLKKVLSANQSKLAEHLLTRESVDPLVSKLIVQLLSGCREADSKVHVLLAECFGELGAIDPGRLELKLLRTEKAVAVHSGVDDKSFAVDLLQRLCRSYLAAEDSRVQVKEDKALKVFRACSLVFKNDSNLALFLLPRVLVCVLADTDAAGREQKVYVALDEPDGVAGVAAVRNSQPSLEEQIIEHQAMGKLADALTCYDRALQLPTSQASHHQGLLSCLLCLDQPSTALTHASGLLAERSDWLPDIIEYQAEAAWRLCSWDLLEKFLQTQDEKSFLDSLAQARSHQTSPLAAAAMEQEAYQRGYRYVSRLHVLTEMEQGFRVLLDMESCSTREEKQTRLISLLEVWKAREDLVQRSPLLLEPLWNVRRALLSITKKKHHDLEDNLQIELAKCWLQSAKLARKDTMVHVVRHYGESLRYGCQHIYHSMPRMLSIWFDLGSQVAEMRRARRAPAGLEKLEGYLKTMTDREIIARLLTTYAPQAVWMMIAVSKSSYPTRVQRCQEIFHLARQQTPSLAKFLNDTLALCEKLLELCNRPVVETNVLQISQHVKGFHEMLKEPSFSRILLPLQSATSVSLPTSGASRDHKPFPQTPIHLVSINDRVDVLSSLQKPKKICVRGSDGKTYAMMLKPKDDLRKDCRLMEFNNLMNRYLKQSAEGLRRRLHIRTYNVVPLNEECGLIEWIPDLQGFRLILNRIYREKGLLVSSKEIKDMMPDLATSVEYTARQSYAQTLAVMSIVGFILGLGDRHGENILFDASCGDAVHVDFNCLFNKA
ncbi:hypothetical protein HPB50_008589 [Hyalomma asiaticum]|uniref:Uncharacterized protein n=1 Tax=Hyalomma asiaticum TaxID=266040 RepID=A0ACB7SUE6_HYAAI|nr:hypothetical protein HPB50_008589 [Hyalomma asiaticum]